MVLNDEFMREDRWRFALRFSATDTHLEEENLSVSSKVWLDNYQTNNRSLSILSDCKAAQDSIFVQVCLENTHAWKLFDDSAEILPNVLIDCHSKKQLEIKWLVLLQLRA